MDNYFIVNPISGGGSAARVLPQIEALAANLKNCHLHTTSEKGSAKTFVHKIAESGRPCRFYAVGGDGTLNEIVNGIYSFSNAEAGFVPCGTGNDFSRCFSPAQKFYDIKAQLDGTSMELDTIETTIDNGKPTMIINMANTGFDCNIVIRADKMRSSGSTAYIKGLFQEFFSDWGFNITIKTDSGLDITTDALLMTAAKGHYCGGGFCSSPLTLPDNGLIDIAVIKNISKLKLLQFLKKYHDGTCITDKKAQDFIKYTQCKEADISVSKPQGICLDGEIYTFSNAHFKCCPKSIKFIVPKGAEYTYRKIKNRRIKSNDNN